MNTIDVTVDLEYNKVPASTFGGEDPYEDDIFFNSYGIDLGDLTITNITPEVMKELTCAMIKHLHVCGHRLNISELNREHGEVYYEE